MTASPEPRLERLAAPADGTALVALGGELDLAISAKLRDLLESVAAETPALVVLDLADVAFMDSTMLRELLRAHRAFEAAGARLVLAGPQPSVRRLLELTGTVAVFELTDSRAAALAGA